MGRCIEMARPMMSPGRRRCRRPVCWWQRMMWGECILDGIVSLADVSSGPHAIAVVVRKTVP